MSSLSDFIVKGSSTRKDWQELLEYLAPQRLRMYTDYAGRPCCVSKCDSTNRMARQFFKLKGWDFDEFFDETELHPSLPCDCSIFERTESAIERFNRRSGK